MKLLALLSILFLFAVAAAKPLPDDPSTSGSKTKHDPLNQIPAHERRGIAYNEIKYANLFDFKGTHVTWRFNWDSNSAPSTAWFKFVPMLHSLRGDHTGKWKNDAETAARENWKDHEGATWLMGFNEPDNCIPDAGGSCIDVATAVKGWKEHMEPLSSFNSKMYLGSPAVTNSAPSDTSGLGWLAKFMDACEGCTVDFINVHWYDSATNIQNFKDYIGEARKLAKGLPIWVTEFRAEGTDDEVRAFLDDVMPWMDDSRDIHRYAYFMARPGKGMLINDAGDGLSDIGKEYDYFHKHNSAKFEDGHDTGKGWEGTRWWEDGQ